MFRHGFPCSPILGKGRPHPEGWGDCLSGPAPLPRTLDRTGGVMAADVNQNRNRNPEEHHLNLDSERLPEHNSVADWEGDVKV